MPLKFYWVSVPISIVFATAYFFWITREKSPTGKKAKGFKDVDVVIHKKASTCHVKAGKGDLLHLHYTGYLKSNGKQFDTTRESEEPYVFKMGTCNEKHKPECVKGFEKGLVGMCVGEKRKVTVPPHMAFGKLGKKELGVPPNDSLIYHIEMVDVDKM